jgi:hypothetical protein
MARAHHGYGLACLQLRISPLTIYNSSTYWVCMLNVMAMVSHKIATQCSATSKEVSVWSKPCPDMHCTC